MGSKVVAALDLPSPTSFERLCAFLRVKLTVAILPIAVNSTRHGRPERIGLPGCWLDSTEPGRSKLRSPEITEDASTWS